MKETEAEKYLKELNEHNQVFNEVGEKEYSEEQLLKFATDFSNQENKELREIILRDLLESMDGTHPEYHYEIVEEALKEHLNNKP